MTGLWGKCLSIAPLRLMMLALAIFWGAFVFFAAIDFAGQHFFQIQWPTGPDIFPNAILGFPLILLQIFSAILFLFSAWRTAQRIGGLKGWIIAGGSSALLMILCFLLYSLLCVYYSLEIAGRFK
jgi:hypothetical protein